MKRDPMARTTPRPAGLTWFTYCALIAPLLLASSALAQCKENGDISANLQKGDDYRGMVTGAIGLTPEVGGALSFAASILWADNSDQELFDQIVDYVNKLVPALIAQEHVRLLQGHVAGLRKIVYDYKHTSNQLQKGEWLTSLLAHLDELEPEFFDDRTPEHTLAHFVTFGSIKLLALREQCLFAEQYYGNDIDHATHLNQLHHEIARYTAAARSIRERAMAWRLSQLRLDHENRYVSHMLYRDFYWVRDDFCGWNSNQTWRLPVINGRLADRRGGRRPRPGRAGPACGPGRATAEGAQRRLSRLGARAGGAASLRRIASR